MNTQLLEKDINDIEEICNEYKEKNNLNIISEHKSTLFEFNKEKYNETYEFFIENINEEEIKDINIILDELNKAILINIDNIYNNSDDECQEILFLLEKKNDKKNKNIKIKNKKINNKCCPFKPLKKPKKISMVGRVLSNSPSNETQCSSNHCINGLTITA